MSDERFFCAANSRAKQESMCGTVARVRSWLLLEYPGTWWRDAVQDSRLLPASAKHHIGRLTRLGAIDRSLLIRRGHAFDFPVHCFFVRSCGIAPQIMGALLPDYDALQNVKPSRPLD